MRQWMRRIVVATAVLLPAGAAAQDLSRLDMVVTSGGVMRFDNAAAIKDDMVGGVEALVHVRGGLTVGPHLFAARAQSDGSYFPPAEFDYGLETTELYTANQLLTILGYGVSAQYAFGEGRFQPFLAAGAGAYTIIMDAQKNDGPTRMSGLRGELGAGVRANVTGPLGFQLEVRDQIFTDYDRDRLYPVGERFRSVRFAEAHGTPPAAKDQIHNLVFRIGFTYMPGER